MSASINAMQTLKQIYRSSYAGENVVTSLTYKDGTWNPVTEHVPNQVFNSHVSTQAIAIGNGESRQGFDLVHIANHKGGPFGADRLQSYGCNALYRDFTPDFLIAVGNTIVDEIAESGYCENHIVYANGKHVINNPGKFYLVPQNVSYDAGALAVYMACFDGHQKIFLLGYDGYDGSQLTNNIYKNTNGYAVEEQNESFWNLSLLSVIRTYHDVEFVSVMPSRDWYLANEFKSLLNFRQIDFRDFVLEADVG